MSYNTGPGALGFFAFDESTEQQLLIPESAGFVSGFKEGTYDNPDNPYYHYCYFGTPKTWNSSGITYELQRFEFFPNGNVQGQESWEIEDLGFSESPAKNNQQSRPYLHNSTFGSLTVHAIYQKQKAKYYLRLNTDYTFPESVELQINGESVSSGTSITCEEGTSVTISATNKYLPIPDDNDDSYLKATQFIKFRDNYGGEYQNNTLSINVVKNITFTASFAKCYFIWLRIRPITESDNKPGRVTLKTGKDGEEIEVLTTDGDSKYKKYVLGGENAIFEASPGPGYVVSNFGRGFAPTSIRERNPLKLTTSVTPTYEDAVYVVTAYFHIPTHKIIRDDSTGKIIRYDNGLILRDD